MDILKMLIDEFNLKPFQVKNTIELLDEGNTIPFIARYRKEQTGELKDIVLRDLSNRLTYLRNLEARQEEVIRLIDEQNKLTEELRTEILASESLQRIEDLYRPFRPKRRTRATIAKEKGLEGLAEIILNQNLKKGELAKVVSTFINEEKEVNNAEEALNGAMDIIAEIISDNPNYREIIKRVANDRGLIVVEAVNNEEKSVYEMYYDYKEPIKTIANHRILAINRGEKDKKLKVALNILDEELINLLKEKVILDKNLDTSEYLERSIEDSYKRLIFPSIEREIRNNLTERAEEEAIKVFALNLKPLLLQPPIKGKTVMAIDPGFRTGCKVAVIDDTGKLLTYTTVYPTEPQNQVEKTKDELKELINKFNVDIIAIGNGTASRETEMVVAEMIGELNKDISYIIVSEAGASIYSASEVGIKEFPDLDVSIRGAVSIGRRLQDPLAELVKIEPKSIGVGQYQHDLNQGKLNESLTGVVEDCVNSVGVDLNTASPSLLKYVAGISTRVADNIINHREEKGKFKNRKELLKVKGLGEKTFIQCGGFLRIPEGTNPLDNTGVHPESYDTAEKLLEMDYLSGDIKSISEELNVGIPTLQDIINELKKPGRDPRDEMPKPILRQDVLKIEDLKKDMVLMGTIRNVVDFGAFVDIGVKEDGLVHISCLSKGFIRHPKEVVKVGDIVKVKILDVDMERGRISLSMKDI
ncbi:RNA-binding transcriptional accessory protein [Tissierella sp. MSJ-40]|uniref:RNA-binding transcriptional accessory protein n=1 Tax=Tissierella simiarum TaxID=2841534 RepID=A0ABS6E117_9FIRM|nr:Tex family protein [Tissierella simiarum]MBU5436593.1 RNA-binding transcriptional accessory protein [Tissierella simiarum]